MSVVYRNCVVPKCRSSVQRTPNKLFIHVPLHQDIRNKWLERAGRKNEFSPKSPIYFCSDHFDLERDMENYMEYKVMGFVKKVKLIKECLPSKFDCQKESSNKRTSTTRSNHSDMLSPEKKPRISPESHLEESDTLLPSSLMVQLPMVVVDEEECKADDLEELSIRITKRKIDEFCTANPHSTPLPAANEDEEDTSANEIEEESSPRTTDKNLGHPTTASILIDNASTSNRIQEHNPIHYLDYIPAINGELKVTRQCQVCRKNNIAKLSRYYCPTCPSQPALCIGICYKNYHENNM